LNKVEERNLAEKIKQITKENRITVNSIKREIDVLKRAFDSNKDRIEFIKRQRQIIHDENLRRLIELNKTKMDMAIMNVYNTSKNLSAFYNLSAIKNPVQTQQIPQQQQQQQNGHLMLVKRSPSRLSARNRYLINTKARICHSAYTKTDTKRSSVNSTLSPISNFPISKVFDDDTDLIDGLFDDKESLCELKLDNEQIQKELVKISNRPVRHATSAPVNSSRRILKFQDVI
jgi:hypothetical protein